jgi:hypothetical protein
MTSFLRKVKSRDVDMSRQLRAPAALPPQKETPDSTGKEAIWAPELARSLFVLMLNMFISLAI